jgi:hypothetical protein
MMPRIGGKRLDGTDDKGREGDPPTLRLTGEPNDVLRSWIVVEVKVDPKSGEIDPENEEAVTIRHVRELRPSSVEIARHPLAVLIWAPNRTTIVRARQITHFHLRHLFVPQQGSEGEDNRGGRHLFWAT